MRGGVNSEPEAGDSMPREKRKFLSLEKGFIETWHANYSIGFTSSSFIEAFKEHKILS
jgi:hypothetical protein